MAPARWRRPALRAAVAGGRFVRRSRGPGPGDPYRVAWDQLPTTAPDRTPKPAEVERLVARLRLWQRLLLGFLDPIEDSLYLVAALRALGVNASWRLGRELAPDGDAGYLPWVDWGGAVISTSVPVREQCVEVFAAPST